MPPLGEYEKPGVIMSGSTPLQAVIGQMWSGSDIDVFCIELYVNRVRNILLNEYGMICCTFWHMDDKDCWPLNHVKTYAPRPLDFSAQDIERAILTG